MKKTTLMKLILIVLLVFAFSVTFSVKDYRSLTPMKDIRERYPITQIVVNSGHEFELVIEDKNFPNGRRVWAFLDAKTSEKAKDSLIKLFNSSSNPRCCLKSKVEDYYIVDIYVKSSTGQDVNILDFLESKGLAFSQ